jgi:hypothetical protein
MGGAHRGPNNRKGNEAKVAKADFMRALRRVVEAELGPDATFAQREAATMAAVDEALREYTEDLLQQEDPHAGGDP